MSHTVWRFEYSVQERIEALRDILVQQEKLLSSHVKREWLYRAQLVLEPAGWYALWRLPRETCQKYGVRFPCVVYVLVDGLELNEYDLIATVEVIGVQDDSVHLPEKPSVPLIQLWATLAQPNTAIEVRSTAEFIDHYRYFYTLIWMPWDLEEDEQDNSRCWFELHVPTRCNLWAASSAGEGCPPYTLHNLRDDGEIIRKHIAHIEESLSSDNEEDIGFNAKNVSILVSLHEQLQALRARWELLQNPALQELWDSTSIQESFVPSEITVVWNGGSLQAHVECLQLAEEWLKCKRISSKKVVGCSPSLVTLFNAKPAPMSIILLCEGSHSLPRNFSLGNHYQIAALSKTLKCSLKCNTACTTAFSVFGTAEMSGMSIDPGSSSTAIAVRKGAFTLYSCVVTASTDTYSQGTVVFDNGEIIYNKCRISGFFTGIVAHKGSKIKLIDCLLENCGVMLQLYEGAKVTLTNCKFVNYKEAAIRYDNLKISSTAIGGIDLLSDYDNIKLTNCQFSEDGKRDVCVTRLDEYAYPQLEGDVTTI